MSVFRVLVGLLVFAGVAYGVRMLAELPRLIQQATTYEGRCCRVRPLYRSVTGAAEPAEPSLAEAGPLTAEYQALQGTWRVVQMISGGMNQTRDGAQVRFTDRSMILIQDGKFPAKRTLTLGYVLLPGAEPRAIDFVPQPEGDKESPRLPGIYQFTENGLLLCVAQGDPARLRRPNAFESREGATDLLLVLQRGR